MVFAIVLLLVLRYILNIYCLSKSFVILMNGLNFLFYIQMQKIFTYKETSTKWLNTTEPNGTYSPRLAINNMIILAIVYVIDQCHQLLVKLQYFSVLKYVI